MLLARLTLVLLLSSFVSAAPVPSASLVRSEPETPISSEWPTPKAASLLPSTQSSDLNNENHLGKRAPYYFPETVPDEEEIVARLTALREAGFLPDTQQGQDQKSIGTPDANAAIDTARARPSPIREVSSALSEREISQSVWQATPMLPAARFLVAASMFVCVATVIRGLRDNGKH
ncbi:hypothetical protein N7532_006729 [Penicillium argentinense]|uniref:Uncharacterized protein n=1 Tax=Penicillium argentinense TaxID=1131581 RepID=A0A9W9FGD1_9EURO|nr:uncharacterized protein N7532_006729 [Penicillium argentinense]KAJ5099728.1 hypothetical protein N7532_006729 [Penicillium argentinense]